ncbi:S-adenosyl-L-methionine-dependent methyltransferase [Syncephalis plumigaleata]|nr:S-adenosyl-L-methionine-dependent methyltransferase [Syncephalis plumigaleata]
MGNTTSKRHPINHNNVVFNIKKGTALPLSDCHSTCAPSNNTSTTHPCAQPTTAFVQTITDALSNRLPRKKSNRSLRSVNSENSSCNYDLTDPLGRHFWWIAHKQCNSGIPLSLSTSNLLLTDSTSTTRFYALMNGLRRNNNKKIRRNASSSTLNSITIAMMAAAKREVDDVDVNMDTLLDKWPITEEGRPLTKSLWKYQLYLFVLGDLFIAPVLNLANVLDVGTSAGDWSLAVAREFPHCQVVGIDSQGNNYPHQHSWPNNCQFKHIDISHGLTIDANRFDLIHWRHHLTSIPSAHWHYCFSELFRCTRPGGWIQVTESDDRHLECGPIAGAINMLVHRFALVNDVDLELLRHLDDVLRAAGFVNVERTMISLPIGRWGGQVGELLLQDNIEKLQTHRKAMLEEGITSEEEIDWLLAGYEREANMTQAYYNVCIYTAQRPK